MVMDEVGGATVPCRLMEIENVNGMTVLCKHLLQACIHFGLDIAAHLSCMLFCLDPVDTALGSPTLFAYCCYVSL